MAKKSKQPNSSNKQLVFIYGALLSVLVIILFGNTISFGFVRDDTFHLHRNPALQSLTWAHLVEIWTESYWRLYIPVTYTLWAIIRPVGELFFGPSTGGFAPEMYHLANILLHAANGVLVFIIIKKMVEKPFAAFLGAMLFVVHPLQVESVAWISELRGLLSTFFGLWFLYRHLTLGQAVKPKRTYIAAQVVLLAFSVLSKPSGVVFPLLVWAVDWLYRGQKWHHALIKNIPYIAVLVPVAIITVLIQPGDEQQEVVQYLWARPLVWADAINFYLFKTIWPFGLATSYNRTTAMLLDKWYFYVEWLIPLLLLYFAFRFRNIHKLYFISLVIFVVGFLPVSGLIGHAYQSWSNVADRFIYVSMLGPALILGYLVKQHEKKRLVKPMVYILLMGLFALSKWNQLPVWKNEQALWEHTISVTDSNARAMLCRADALVKQEQYREALNDYNQALAIEPDYEGYNSRGIAYYNLEMYDKAMDDYNASIALNPDYQNVYNNRGNLFLEMGEYIKALDDYNRAIALKPGDYRPYINKGNALIKLKRHQDALDAFNKAYAKGARVAVLYLNRGIAYKTLKSYDKAIADFARYNQLKPMAPDGYYHLSQLYFMSQNYQAALGPITRYIELKPEDADGLYNRAKINYFLGRYQQALRDMRNASAKGGVIEKSFYDAVMARVN